MGLVAWLAGVDFMLLNMGDDARWIGGWLVSAGGLLLTGATLLSALVRRRPTRWSFPGTVLAVPRSAGLPPLLFLGLLGVLLLGVPVLLAVFFASFA